MSVGYRYITYEKKDGVARLTFNRPEKLNAFTWEMLEEVVHAINDARGDPETRALLLTGAGRSFSSGMDVAQITDVMSDKLMPTAVIVSALKDFEKPAVAMVNGPAVGAAVDVVLFCDFAVASEEAYFWYSYIVRGAIPSAGAWLLPRVIGVKKAMQMLLLSDRMGAREAERSGLVYKTVPAEKLEDETAALVSRVAAIAPVAYGLTKRSILKGLERDLATSIEYAAYARAVASRHKEAEEGVKAFFEKRQARY